MTSEESKPRQRRAEITREKICTATIKLLGTGGAKAVTHRSVAQLAKVSLASTTYHFKDKAELLTTAFDWLIEQYTSQARNKLEAALAGDTSPQSLARHLVSVSKHDTAVASQRIVVCAWYEFMLEACRDPQLRATVDKWYGDTCGHYQELLEKFGSRSPADDTRRLVDFLIGYEFISLATHAGKLGGHDIAEICDRFVQSMFESKQPARTRGKHARKTAKARS